MTERARCYLSKLTFVINVMRFNLLDEVQRVYVNMQPIY